MENTNQVQLIDYNENCIAVIGDTKAIKEELKAAGSRYNPYLKCGKGWIFSKKKNPKILSLMQLNTICSNEQLLEALKS